MNLDHVRRMHLVPAGCCCHFRRVLWWPNFADEVVNSVLCGNKICIVCQCF